MAEIKWNEFHAKRADFLIQNVEISQSFIDTEIELSRKWSSNVKEKKSLFILHFYYYVCYNITSEIGTMTSAYALLLWRNTTWK